MLFYIVFGLLSFIELQKFTDFKDGSDVFHHLKRKVKS